ncbi:HAUS augmin-like complex subunit 7 isoform X7 [Dermochelys coriacea]|uniref:HAUS augmin-like complex subunit 7 isoform X7 n=1 Tax=Dermochelys coriacea TaxID=27794 RepID=UPI001CA8F451|nr:HAUS augmin-like complex subunit 7 isoform X7 [Dermochelys coriacea]
MAAPAAASVYEQMKELRCPLLDGVFLPEPGAALRLLCAPSAQRLELLAWLCARANPPPPRAICYPQGLADGGENSSAEESLRGAARKNEEFLREVFSSPSLPALLAPALPSCTADIKPLLLEEPAPHVRTQLSVRSSGKTLAELSRTLEEANAALERLRAESSSLRGGAEPLSPGMALQTLALAACDSHQLMAAFGQVYETELREHCGRGPAPRLSPCGPLAQHLQGTLTLCTQELQALAQLNDTSEQVVQTAEWRRSKGSNPTATLPVKMEELRRRYQACLAAAGELPG